jgi:hypothetical protein
MTGKRDGGRPDGMVIGCLIALSFGTVFVMVNSGGLDQPWQWVIRGLGLAIAAVLLVALFRTARTARPQETSGPGFADRRFQVIVALEVIALFGGLYVINSVLDRSELGVAWVAVVVGVHFYALGWAWGMTFYHWLATAMTALGVGGFVAYAAGAGETAVALISGVGSGLALYATVATILRQASRQPERVRSVG